MSQVIVFNHHSLPYDDQSEARKAVPGFIRVVLKCRIFGYNLMLLDESLDPNWFEIPLAPGYVWRNWYNEALNDNTLKESVRAFRSLQTRQPLLAAVDMEESGHCRDVGLQGTQEGLPALLASHVHDSFLVSFPSSDIWRNNRISVWVLDLDNRGEGFSETLSVDA